MKMADQNEEKINLKDEKKIHQGFSTHEKLFVREITLPPP
jgi:hypothetical protein